MGIDFITLALAKKYTDEKSMNGGVSGKFVSYDKKQTLTDKQKEQARANIGVEIATDDEVIDMLAQEDMLPVVVDTDGGILSDENKNVLLW